MGYRSKGCGLKGCRFRGDVDLPRLPCCEFGEEPADELRELLGRGLRSQRRQALEIRSEPLWRDRLTGSSGPHALFNAGTVQIEVERWQGGWRQQHVVQRLAAAA